MSQTLNDIKAVFPKVGQLIIEDIDELVLCKPRLIPLKSFTLEKLEKMQQQAQDIVLKQQQQQEATNKD